MSSNSKLWQTCVSKVIVFCVTPIVPESFMIVSSTNVLVQLFLMVGGFGGRSYDYICIDMCPQKCKSKNFTFFFLKVVFRCPGNFENFKDCTLESLTWKPKKTLDTRKIIYEPSVLGFQTSVLGGVIYVYIYI